MESGQHQEHVNYETQLSELKNSKFSEQEEKLLNSTKTIKQAGNMEASIIHGRLRWMRDLTWSRT